MTSRRPWAREFHVHVDASWIDPGCERRLLDDIGLRPMEFLKDQCGTGHAPDRHLTGKFTDPRAFRAASARVLAVAGRWGAMQGYIELEVVGPEIHVPPRPFDPHVALPFEVTLAPLPSGAFREAEIHVTLSRDESDPRLITALQRAGFMSAFLPKPYGVAHILTLHGDRRTVADLIGRVTAYLERAGGCVRCQVKEERVSSYWMSAPDVPRAPVVGAVRTY